MRINYVDAFRGIALLGMIFLHLYDALAPTSIYLDAPFFINELNAPLFNPPALFTIVAGMSTYLMIKSMLKKHTRNETAKKSIRIYLKYILISLPFTTFMWGINTYIEWNEAIQGIGLSAIILALIIIYLRPKNYELILSIPLLSIAREELIKKELTGIIFNPLFKGWFSIMNLLPLMISGVIYYKLTRKLSAKNLAIISTAITITSLMLHYTGLPINYYGKSMNFTLYAIGTSWLTYSIILPLTKSTGKLMNLIISSGKKSFRLYVGHHILLIKPLMITRITIPETYSIIIAGLLTYLISKALLFNQTRTLSH